MNGAVPANDPAWGVTSAVIATFQYLNNIIPSHTYSYIYRNPYQQWSMRALRFLAYPHTYNELTLSRYM